MSVKTLPTIMEIEARSILSPASGYIGAYDYTLTPYRGCTFGCSYCYVPTLVYHRAQAASWGFALTVKKNAAELLLRQARRGGLVGKRIFCSPNTDPYLPQERQFGLTRRLLEIFCEYPPGLLMIQTRSPLVARDLDLLVQLRDRVVVGISITTNRDDVRRVFEPRCPSIRARVSTLAQLHGSGIRTQASLAPLLPCHPDALADLVDAHCDWVVVQALKTGQGARTWAPALRHVEQQGWDGWLQGRQDIERAMRTLRDRFGPRYHESQEGFSLGWIGRDRDAAQDQPPPSETAPC